MQKIKIVSGAQTGADQGGLAAGLELGLEIGGFVPEGWMTELGDDTIPPEYKKHLEQLEGGYRERTVKNIHTSDATIIFSDKLSPGTKLTRNECRRSGKPYMIIRFDTYFEEKQAEKVRSFLKRFDVKVLNVAGNRASVVAIAFSETKRRLVLVLQRYAIDTNSADDVQPT